ncbi:MAG: hypothetical protein HON90_08855, partial [Halobacteriovoraceae bacterium]|nr:hypothetical protein [Halobacteriovoraceae bacterium]
MKLLFILLIFISSSLSYADAKPIEIKLSLNLELRQLCNNSSPFCTVEGKVFLGGTKIILKPVLETMCQSNGDGTTTCSSPELCESGDENCPQPSH